MIEFNSSPNPTIGVEIELQLVDKKTLDLKNISSKVLADVDKKFTDKIKCELVESMIEINTDICSDIDEVEKDIKQTLNHLEEILTNNRILRQRSVDIGIISKQEAIEWGCTGPVLRSAGVAWDLRRSQPYDAYDKVDFEVPVGKKGDCFDRYLVRIEEMRQSISIIQQCLTQIKSGEISVIDNKITPPKRSEMKHSIESLIHHYK